MKLPFLQMKWSEHFNNNHAEYGHELSLVDWSWLETKEMPSLERLWVSEWSDNYEKVLRGVCDFNDNDILRTRYRMVMGALRYGLLSEVDADKYSTQYYVKRLTKCMEESADNLEAIYDFANLLRLGAERGKIDPRDVNMLLTMLHDLRLACVGEKVPYVPVDRKDF